MGGPKKFRRSTLEVSEIVYDPETSRSYRREELLGKGSSGHCFKMTDLASGEAYAVKVIPLRSKNMDEALQEVAILQMLQHRHVVGVSHSFKDKYYMYIFMELCLRQTLRNIIAARRTLTNPEVRYYMRQLISGLKYIHEQGYIHRDIKLENLLITEGMDLKIADFGLATKMELRKGEVCGTAEYVAPEVWKGQGHGPEADVWAVGCAMYILLVGHLPFLGSDFRLVGDILGGVYTLPSSLPRTARKLIKKIFKDNPEDRPTLDQILQHKFFTKGFTPEELSLGCCDTVPQFERVNCVRKFFRRLAQRLFRRNRSRA